MGYLNIYTISDAWSQSATGGSISANHRTDGRGRGDVVLSAVALVIHVCEFEGGASEGRGALVCYHADLSPEKTILMVSIATINFKVKK